MKSHFVSARFLSTRFSFSGVRSLVFASALVVVGPILPVAAQEGGSGSGAASETEAGEVVAVLRSAAPKELLPKVMEIARQIQPGPQTEALPFILGGMLGDPSLQGISPVENMGIVVLARGEEVTPVVVLHLTEQSPLSAALTNNFGLTLREHEGWTFGLQAETSPDVIAGRERALIDLVRDARRYDLEVVADVSVFAGKLRQELEPLLSGELETGSLAKPVLDAVMAEADAMERAGFGLNLSRELIQPVYFLDAKAGTPLAVYLDQKRPEDLDFAKFVEADGTVAALGGYDVRATRVYIDHLANAVDLEGSPEVMKTFRELVAWAGEFIDKTSGAQAAVLSFEGFLPSLVSVIPSEMSDPELQSLLSTFAGLQDSLLREVAELDAGGDASTDVTAPSYSLSANVAEIDGLPVHSFTTHLNLSVEEGEAAGFDRTMLMEPHENYYVLADGYLVNATSLDKLRKTVEAVRGGEAVANNLSDLVSLRPDELFRVQVNLLHLFEGNDALPMPMEMAEVFAELQAQDLPPLTLSFSAVDGRAEGRIEIPVKTIAAVAQAVRARREAHQREQMQETWEVNPTP